MSNNEKLCNKAGPDNLKCERAEHNPTVLHSAVNANGTSVKYWDDAWAPKQNRQSVWKRNRS